jgi:hypothetical protein
MMPEPATRSNRQYREGLRIREKEDLTDAERREIRKLAAALEAEG